MTTEIIKTADGSHSIYVKELDEHYHSIHGAIQESKHVFIEMGLKYMAATLPNSEINILEIGLGTGLNAFLTFIESEKTNSIINYTSIEAYPIPTDTANQLNYLDLLNEQKNQFVFDKIHTCEWDKINIFSNQFSFRKINNTLQQIIFDDTYNLIYFDAFGPRVQPEMWTEELFAKLYAATLPNGCLVTYCAKGEVKRTLKKVGFIVKTLQGPPGKREMVRAVKTL